MERVRALAAVAADDHAHRERGAVLVGAERAQIVGDALRQHRHHAVGEIDRVAALQRLAVERRARPHVVRDVGDGDGEDVAAGIVRIGIGRGMDRVVVVLGVDRIDGDERELAPVLAAGEIGGLRRMRLGLRRDRKHMRDVVGVDGDQADRALALDRAEPLLDARGRQAEPAVRLRR